MSLSGPIDRPINPPGVSCWQTKDTDQADFFIERKFKIMTYWLDEIDLPLLTDELPPSEILTPESLMKEQTSIQGYKWTLISILGLEKSDPRFKEAIELFKQTRWQEIEDRRVKLCGRLVRVRNPKTGEVVEYHKPCNIFRKCSFCNERRKEQNEQKLKRLIGKKVITLDNDEAGQKDQAKIARRLGKDRYHVEKTDNDKIHIIVDADDDLDYFEKRWELGELSNEQAEEIAERSIPEKGNRKSGNLAKKETIPIELEEEPKGCEFCDGEEDCMVCASQYALDHFEEDIARQEGKLGEVHQRPIKMDCNEGMARLITAQAIRNLGNPTFRTVEDMQVYFDRYEEELEKIATNRKIVILFEYKRSQLINLNDINWKDAEEIATRLENRY